MSTWQAVAPVAPLSALPNREHALGPGVTIAATPEWSKPYLQSARRGLGQLETLDSPVALVSTFEADSFGDPDPAWTGSNRRSKQDTAEAAIHAAAAALWLARPSPLHFEVIVIGEVAPTAASSRQSVRPFQPFQPLTAHENATLSMAALAVADTLATAIRSVPHPSALWTALRFLTFALCETEWEIRLLHHWVAIEALFGPDDGKLVSRRIPTRAARFLNPSDDNEARIGYQLVRDNYRWRCAASHGGRFAGLTPKTADEVLLEAESILMTCLRRILENAAHATTFSSANRDSYLEGIAATFSP
jgi:hypothetical protein